MPGRAAAHSQQPPPLPGFLRRRVVNRRATSRTCDSQAQGACPYRGLGHKPDLASIRCAPRAPQLARPRAPCVRLLNPTLRQTWPRERPGAAMCVQGIDVQCVLQFTLINAAGCALHRCTSRVIHRSKLYFWIHDHLQGRPAAARIALIYRTPPRGGPRQSWRQAKHWCSGAAIRTWRFNSRTDAPKGGQERQPSR